jgi:hypothetical protein
MTAIGQKREVQLRRSAVSAARLEQAYQAGRVSRVCGPSVKEWRLRAQLNVMVRRGEIAPEVVFRTSGATIYAYFRRLRPPRSRMAIAAWLSLAGAGTLSAVLWLLWESRYVILYTAVAIASTAALLMVAASAKNGHACIGIHCPGCKG